MKVILDANVFVSFLLTRSHTISSIFKYWDENRFALLVSDEILEEYMLIFDKLLSKGYEIKKHEFDSLIKKVNKRAINIKITSKLNLSSDKKDNRYINCAKDGKADYLVTGDKADLLNIGNYKYTQIISVSEFYANLKLLDYR